MTDIHPNDPLFAPFENWGDGHCYGLCVQDGQVTSDPADGRDWVEYHLEFQGGGMWELSAHQGHYVMQPAGILYRGKIPSRGGRHHAERDHLARG